MKYLWTSLFVKDLEKSIDFYEKVTGLKVARRFQGGPGTEIAFMQSEDTETKVELICNGHEVIIMIIIIKRRRVL